MKIRLLSIVALLAMGAGARARDLPRAMVADLGNESGQKYTMVSRTASDALATELQRGNVFDIISRQEVDRVAKSHNFHPPYAIEDMAVVARELDARYLVYGEIKTADIRIGKDRGREAEI